MVRRHSGELSFDPLESEPGIRITDPIERCQYDIRTAGPVSYDEADPELFPVPVDAAIEVTTERLTLRRIVHAYVRDHRGELVAEISPGVEETTTTGVFDVELNAPVKLYLRLRGPFTTRAGLDELTVECHGEGAVLVGARSYHQRPATTIETTDAPEDVLRAIAHLGSALKTTSCERSFPTLRGHPPLLTVGDRFSVPDEVSRPSTGVRLELPATLRAGLVAAPLAYYLGADVVPGETPRLVTDAGFEHRLDGPDGVTTAVERTLKQTLFLDCLTRTEGRYRVELHERTAVEPTLDLDPAALYDRPLAEQLEAYLSVPFDAVEDHLPTWVFAAHLPIEPASVEALPFVVNELGTVRPAVARRLSSEDVRAAVVDGYASSDSTRAPARSSQRSVDGDPGLPTLVEVESTGAFEEAWFGEHAPIRGTKSTVRAFQNALDRRPKEGPIDVVVVCNGQGRVEASDVVTDVYGSREELEFDVTLHYDLGTTELGDVLSSSADFLHYVGHIDADGIACRDGHLDVTDLESVGVDAFLLNGCRSYDQGLALIEAGSIGGVVTIADVIDSGAITVGRNVARLLNLGFSLRSALSVARESSVVGGHYLVVGTGRIAIAQAEFGSPMVVVVESTDGDDYRLTIRAYLPVEGGMGSMVYPPIESNERYYLYPGSIGPFQLPERALGRYLTWHQYPVEIDGEWVWRAADRAIGEVL